IVSDRVGCAEDLVRPGWNGFVVGHTDVGALARAIGTLVAEPGARVLMGARGRSLVDGYSVERCADGIERACRRAVAPSREAAACAPGPPPPRSGWACFRRCRSTQASACRCTRAG